MKKIKHKKLFKSLISIFSIILLIIIVMLVYFSIYYKAEDVSKYIESSDIVIATKDKNLIEFKPKNEDTNIGIIIYPGAKVDYLAYSPLAYNLSNIGYDVFIVSFPFRFAFFNMKAADSIIEENNNITNWYIIGHSLGGAIAGSYLEKNYEKFDGLILLASYVTTDLSNTDLKVLSIYGSNDEVINKKNYEKYYSNLPLNTTEVIIDGGCHAYFASYGAQKGDGTPTITREEQTSITVSKIKELIQK